VKYAKNSSQVLSSQKLEPVIDQETETPSTPNPLGIKGIGEAGANASTPAMTNAVRDVLP